MIAPPVDDADIPRYTHELGLPGLADIHVHFLPPSMLAKVWAYFDQAQEHYGTPWPIHYRTDQDARLATLRSFGLKAIPALSYPHKPGMAQWLNEWAGELADAEPDVIRCATVFPEPGAADDLDRALTAGARLVKMHVQVGGYDPRDLLLDDVWRLLEQAVVPVVIHAGSAPISGAHTGADPIDAVLQRFPNLALVIAHLGMSEYGAFADLAERYANVYLDTTMVGTDFMNRTVPVPQEHLQRLVGLKDKVVLGSDFPNIPYPYAHQLQALHRFGIGDDWLRSVLWHNGSRLLDISA